MLESTKDYDAGLKYVDQSLAMKEDWYNLFIKGQLLAAKGNYKEATLRREGPGAGAQGPELFPRRGREEGAGRLEKKKKECPVSRGVDDPSIERR